MKADRGSCSRFFDRPRRLRAYVDDSPLVARRPELSQASDADREAAFFGWASRVVDEQASVLAFAELLGHLGAIAAPLAALETVHGLLGDELRHVRLCAEVASWFGDLDSLEIDLEDLSLPPTDEPRASRALEIVVRELVVGEAESLIALRAYRDATSDPAVREAYAILLYDEARHASAGRNLEAVLRASFEDAAFEPFLSRRDDVAEADRRHHRAVHRAGATGGPGRAFGVSIFAHEIPALPSTAPPTAPPTGSSSRPCSGSCDPIPTDTLLP